MPTREKAKQEFAKRLRKLMLDRNWNQSELARRSKMGRDSISCYMRALNLPEALTIKKLAKALGVSEEDLLPSEMNPSSNAFHADETAEEEASLRSLDNGRYYLRVGKSMSLEKALKIMEILKEEDASERQG